MDFESTASNSSIHWWGWLFVTSEGEFKDLGAMAKDLSCEESDYGSDWADSVGSSKSVCLSCKFSFESGSSGSEAADGGTVEPYQYEPLGSQSSGGTKSSGGSADEESAGTKMLLNTEW